MTRPDPRTLTTLVEFRAGTDAIIAQEEQELGKTGDDA